MPKQMTAFISAATFMLALTTGLAQKPDQSAALREMDGLHLTEYLKENFAHDWILPAGKTHIVLAVPGSAEFDKTYVEPDGSVSPGVGSYGLTTWLYDISNHRLYAPDEMEEDRLNFHLEDGHIPIAHSSWNAGTLHLEKRITVVLKNPDSLESEVYMEVKIDAPGEKAADFLLYVAIRPLGPAGGPVKAISAIDNGRTVLLNGTPAIQFDPAPTSFGATSFNSGGDDISRWAKRGSVPLGQSISSDSLGLARGAAVYHLHIDPKKSLSIYARLALRNADRRDSLTGELSSSDALRQFNEVAGWWKRTLEKVDITANEPFGRDTYYASIACILMNSVGNQLRVTNVRHPVTYLRDGVYMLNAIDQAGLHDRAKQYLEYFVKHPWSGAESQEGPEGDAPGKLCWIIGEHFRLTHDIGWLRSVYPFLLQGADLILFLENPVDGETREIGGVKLVARGTSVHATGLPDFLCQLNC